MFARRTGKVLVVMALLLPVLAVPLARAEETKLTLALAASLEKVFVNELIPMFEAANPGLVIEGVYDASGRLQTQMEEGLAADVFVSAAHKQMNALADQAIIDASSVEPLLENKLVAIAPVGSAIDIARFYDLTRASVIAIGDPASVPAGQYAREALTYLGIYDEVLSKASLGMSVTEVLNWVGEGSCEVGIVYLTDAKNDQRVKVLCVSPEGSLKSPVIYPVGVLKGSGEPEMAKAFVEFLKGEEASAVFEAYGFTPCAKP